MIFPKFTASEYLFTKDLAANIVYAEVKHFADEMSLHGPSEDEVQTLTRTIAYKIDKDLNWASVDELVDQVRHLQQIVAGTADEVRLNEQRTIDNRAYLLGSHLPYVWSNIDAMLSGVKARYEVAA